MVAPLFPAMLGAATSFLPAASSFLAASSKGSAGVLQIVEKKLRSWEDKEFAMRERVRSRMHVVFVLRPCIEGPSGSKHEAAPVQAQTVWSRWFSRRSSDQCNIAGMTVTCTTEEPRPVSLSLGEGAERHEMVLCKSQGYICVDYKGMLYRMIQPDGKVMPGGLKAIRLNVMYDLLRSAAQSGEFSIGNSTPLPATAGASISQANGNLPEKAASPNLSTTTSRGAHTLVEAVTDLPSPPSAEFLKAQTTGLSEAMGAWSRIRMRAEMHCMRGDAVMFATYSDVEFTRDQMMTGVNLHATGEDDAGNPYCDFVTKKMNSLLAQGEILGVADLHSVSATSSATPEEELTSQAPSHPKTMAECYKSFSRIQDITELSTQFSKSVMPWLGKLSVSSAGKSTKK